MLYLSMASAPAEFEYTGRATIVFDDHHPEYELDMVKGDRFTVRTEKNLAYITHKEVQGEEFVAKFTDKKYNRLMNNAQPTKFVFMPSPANPVYPLITKMDKKVMELLYVHFNKAVFNGACPPASKVVFSEKIPKNSKFRGKAAGLMESTSAGYRLSVDLTTAKGDPYVFVDILLHEMIHLFQQEQYRKTKNEAYLDGHGATFVKEMERINRLGFNVDKVLDWEKRECKSQRTDELFLILGDTEDPRTIVYHQLFWSQVKPTVAQLNKLHELLGQRNSDSHTRIRLLRTEDAKVRSSFIQLKVLDRLPKRVHNFEFSYIAPYLEGATTLVVSEFKPPVAHSIGAKFKIAAGDVKYMTGPIDEYFAHIKKGANDYGNPIAAWNNVTIGRVNKDTTEILRGIYMQVKAGVKDSEVRRMLRRIPERYQDRFTPVQYRKAIRDIIEKNRFVGLDKYKELKL